MQVHVPKCCNRPAYMRRNGTFIFMLSVEPNVVLKLLEQYGCPNTCVPNIVFLYLHSTLLFHDRGPYHIETSPLICSASVMKALNQDNYCKRAF